MVNEPQSKVKAQVMKLSSGRLLKFLFFAKTTHSMAQFGNVHRGWVGDGAYLKIHNKLIKPISNYTKPSEFNFI